LAEAAQDMANLAQILATLQLLGLPEKLLTDILERIASNTKEVDIQYNLIQ
jgi:hypothetical protein